MPPQIYKKYKNGKTKIKEIKEINILFKLIIFLKLNKVIKIIIKKIT